MYDTIPDKRYRRTLEFMKNVVEPGVKILDLGVNNPFSEIMREQGWEVENTGGEDLDIDQSKLKDDQYDVLTDFEILEHTLNPFTILSSIKANRSFISIPLRYWFKSAYKSDTDKWDRHFHEFEVWQFDWLLEKTGWKIIRSEKWKSADSWIGFRPFLRHFYDRYYLVEVVRI